MPLDGRSARYLLKGMIGRSVGMQHTRWSFHGQIRGHRNVGPLLQGWDYFVPQELERAKIEGVKTSEDKVAYPHFHILT